MSLFWSVVVNLGSKTHFKYVFLIISIYIFEPPKMSGSKVFLPSSKIFVPYYLPAVTFLTDLSQPAPGSSKVIYGPKILYLKFPLFVDSIYITTLALSPSKIVMTHSDFIKKTLQPLF